MSMMPTTRVRKGIAGMPYHSSSIDERLKRLRAQELASAAAEEIINFHLGVMRNDAEPTDNRMKAGKWLYELAFGKPAQSVNVSGESNVKQVVEIRWLPADPADTSKLIEPESDD